jgi:hypothetical protein
MKIELSHEVVRLLEGQVALGRFPSVEAAVAALALDDAAAQADLDHADLTWAKPFIAEGLVDLAAARTRPADEVHSELRARFAKSVS